VRKAIASDKDYLAQVESEYGLATVNDIVTPQKVWWGTVAAGVASGVSNKKALMAAAVSTGVGNIFGFLEEMGWDEKEHMFGMTSLVSSMIGNSLEFFFGALAANNSKKADREKGQKAMVNASVGMGRDAAIGYLNSSFLENAIYMTHYLAAKAEFVTPLQDKDYLRTATGAGAKATSLPGYVYKVGEKASDTYDKVNKKKKGKKF
jgi:hypothetical protein